MTKVRCRAFHIHHLPKDELASPPEKEVSILEINGLFKGKDMKVGA